MTWPTPAERYVDLTSRLAATLTCTSTQLVKAAETVNNHGARKVYAIVTHGILSGKAIDNINRSCLSGLVVTNSACPPTRYSRHDADSKT